MSVFEHLYNDKFLDPESQQALFIAQTAQESRLPLELEPIPLGGASQTLESVLWERQVDTRGSRSSSARATFSTSFSFG